MGNYYAFFGAGLVTGGEGVDCEMGFIEREYDEPPVAYGESKKRRPRGPRIGQVCSDTSSDELGLRIGFGNRAAFNDGDTFDLGWEFAYQDVGEIGTQEVDMVGIGPTLRAAGLPGGTELIVKPSLIWYDGSNSDWGEAIELGIEKTYTRAFWRVSYEYINDLTGADLDVGWLSVGWRL